MIRSIDLSNSMWRFDRVCISSESNGSGHWQLTGGSLGAAHFASGQCDRLIRFLKFREMNEGMRLREGKDIVHGGRKSADVGDEQVERVGRSGGRAGRRRRRSDGGDENSAQNARRAWSGGRTHVNEVRRDGRTEMKRERGVYELTNECSHRGFRCCWPGERALSVDAFRFSHLLSAKMNENFQYLSDAVYLYPRAGDPEHKPSDC